MSQVYFVTNRDPKGAEPPTGFGKGFNSEAPDCLRFGKATVTGKKVTVVTAAEKLGGSTKTQKLGSKEVFADLQADMRKGADTIVFIHGYNVSFEAAMQTGDKVRRLYPGRRNVKRNVVVFSWPSDGSMLPFLAYKSDRADARSSSGAFARGLMKLAEFLDGVLRKDNEPCKARIHLMCHSMGNYVLRNGVQEMRRVEGALPRLFDQIFLFAPDEDYDAFEHNHKLAHLPEMGQAVNVYFNAGDTALVVSDKTKSNPARLGSRGPRLPLNVPGSVTLVDGSKIVGGLMEHSYFLDDKRVAFDVNQVLDGKGPEIAKTRKYVASQNRYELKKFGV